MSLNERIAKVIEYSQLSSSEFADEVDVQRSSISHITSGRNKPSLEFIIKIKSRFPEILWDWLVTGEGEMLKSELPDYKDFEETPDYSDEPVKPTPLPDLFEMIKSDTSFGSDERIEEPVKQPIPEVNISQQQPIHDKISGPQQIEQLHNNSQSPAAEKQTGKIKRIIIFYEDGKFESFEP